MKYLTLPYLLLIPMLPFIALGALAQFVWSSLAIGYDMGEAVLARIYANRPMKPWEDRLG